MTDRYRKKPLVITAVQQFVPFEVETLEGTMRGKAGDWLITGVEGEQYPCADSVFRASYELDRPITDGPAPEPTKVDEAIFLRFCAGETIGSLVKDYERSDARVIASIRETGRFLTEELEDVRARGAELGPYVNALRTELCETIAAFKNATGDGPHCTGADIAKQRGYGSTD